VAVPRRYQCVSLPFCGKESDGLTKRSRVVSIILIMAGGMLYTYIKSRPAAPKPVASSPEVREPLLSDDGLEKGRAGEEKAGR
jgi:hypothetical protein